MDELRRIWHIRKFWRWVILPKNLCVLNLAGHYTDQIGRGYIQPDVEEFAEWLETFLGVCVHDATSGPQETDG